MASLNGGEPDNAEETTTWANSVLDTPEDKGVFTSMLNVGLDGIKKKEIMAEIHLR